MKTWQSVSFSSQGALNPQWFANTLGDFLNKLKLAPGEVLVMPPASDVPWLHHVLVYTEKKVEGCGVDYCR